MWERCCAASPTHVIFFVGDHPTCLSALSVGQVVCESTIMIKLLSCLLDKNEVLNLWERCCAASPTHVIFFVGDHPTSLSALSVDQVVCESTIMIKLLSCLLDKNEVLNLWERCCAASPTNVIFFVRDHPTSMSTSSVGQLVCESTILIQLFQACWIKQEVLHLWE